jgi:DNA polymerase I
VSWLDAYREVWLVDFEFGPAGRGAYPEVVTDPEDWGENPDPRCFVALEFHSGRLIRQWCDGERPTIPYGIGADCLFVAFYASAEIGCHLSLGWPAPARVLDLFTEFRNKFNGRPPVLPQESKWSLLSALATYGLDSVGAAEKKEMRGLALRGGSYTDAERLALLDYCESDVRALERLLPRMLPDIDLPRALLRGRAMAAAARVERHGIPVDVETWRRLVRHWDAVKLGLIAEVDKDYGVFEGTHLRKRLFAQWAERVGIPWPRDSRGAPIINDELLEDMEAAYGDLVAPLRQLISKLSKLKLSKLSVGSDGRNRRILSAFASRTGRFQPSNSRFIFGTAKALRSLMKPGPGMAIAYVDCRQQEFGIAAKLSGDENMLAAYATEDAYMAFAIQAGAAPPGAKKGDSKEIDKIRGQFKVAAGLGIMYWMGAKSLAFNLSCLTLEAARLLRLSESLYSKY